MGLLGEVAGGMLWHLRSGLRRCSTALLTGGACVCIEGAGRRCAKWDCLLEVR